jgi:NAD(P)-dependent dehydrogenase (short-subunit alcohol dehydrogenase family)
MTNVTGLLAGKTILIIGGTSGLGMSAARAFIQAGASVALTGRSLEKVESARSELPESALVYQCDAQDPDRTNAVLQDVVAKCGRLDGLYHVAGGSGRSLGDGALHEITDEGWRMTVSLNLDSVFISNRAAVRQFLSQGSRGAIANMGSVLGYSPSARYFASHAYAATKSAIIGFTRSIAAYYASRDIRANVLAPGLVATPMAERAQHDREILDFIHTKQPLGGGRIAAPDDYDGAAIFLMSDQSRFMTGQVVTVDGGWTVSEGQYSCTETETETERGQHELH